MGNLLWPTFPGMTLNVRRQGPIYQTDIQQSRSGKEQRIAYWAIPRFRYELEIEFARSGGNLITVSPISGGIAVQLYETEVLEWFISQTFGSWDTFYLNDPLRVQSAYYIVGATPIGPPVLTGSSVASGGASLPLGTYYYVVTSDTAAGESVQSNEVTVVIASGGLAASLTWPAVAGATRYKIYRTTLGAGMELLYSIRSTNSYTDTNTTNSYGAFLPPQVKVRFDMDEIELQQLTDYSRVWSAKSIKLITCK